MTKTDRNTCRICDSVALPSKALVNYHNIQHSLNPHTSVEFVTKMENCLKCSNCGHSWINSSLNINKLKTA